MGLAGCDDRINLLGAAPSGLKRFLCSLRTERQFGFAFRGIGYRLDAGAAAELADGHAKRAVDFFRSEGPGSGDEARASQKNGSLRCGI